MSTPSRALFLAAVTAFSVVTMVGDAGESSAAFPGENGQIVFTRNDETTTYEDIWVVNPDGTVLSRLTHTPNRGERYPTWSPDGSQIAYVDVPDSGGNAEVWVMNHDGSNPQQVTDLPGDWGARYASWAPDGNGFVVEVEYWGASHTDLYVVDIDGSGLTQLTGFPGSEQHPAWSPDGSRIAFYTYDLAANPGDIWTIAPDGSDLTQITNDPRRFHEPNWSPDGSKIAFWQYEFPSHFVWIADANGANAEAITTGGYETEPAWSPDGTQIVYRDYTGDAEIWVMDADGSNPESLGVDGAKPDWGPAFDPPLGPPIALGDGPYNAHEGATLMIVAPGVLDNDVDPSGGPLRAVQASDAAHGTARLNEDGSFAYTPDPGFSGIDAFTYRAHDADGLASNETTVTLMVQIGNHPPVARDDTFYVVRGRTLFFTASGVLFNDTDAEDGEPVEAVKKSEPRHGTVTLNADGSLFYQHDGSTEATDSFTYAARDSGGKESNVATVTLEVSGEVHTVGLVDPAQGKWYLYDENGAQKSSFFFGNPGDFPIYGDWDCDGIETPGMYRQDDGFVYLRNTNTQGIGNIRFFFGNPGDIPLAGDFNGDGCDTVSIYRPDTSQVFVINELGKDEGGLGAAEFSYYFGDPGDEPFVGDFDGNGEETIGLHRETTGLVYFRQTHTQGSADSEFIFGDPGDRLVAGSWMGHRAFSPALFRPSNTTMYFRYTNTPGGAHTQWVGGASSWVPISGYNGLG